MAAVMGAAASDYAVRACMEFEEERPSLRVSR